MDKLVNFRASEEEIEAWKASAWESHMSLSAWLRRLANDLTVFETARGKMSPKPLQNTVLNLNDRDS